MLQPVNDQVLPIKIRDDFQFQNPPLAKCLYHPLPIKHFCTIPECLMPLCSDCLMNHPRDHTHYVTNFEESLTQVYRQYSRRANEIALLQRNDILSLRRDLHRLIDRLVDDVLERADNNYEEELVLEWRNLIKRLEKLNDPSQCLQQVILYYSELDQPYRQTQLYYQDRPVQINHQALDQVKYHLNHLFTAYMDDREYFFSVGDITRKKRSVKTKWKNGRTVSRERVHEIAYLPSNYNQSPLRQVIPTPVVYLDPAAAQLQAISPLQSVQHVQPVQHVQAPVYQKQPLVVYQESPIKFVPQTQPHVVPISNAQSVPMLKSPQTVASVYPGSVVHPFLATSQNPNEYAHPYNLKQQ